MFFSAVNLGILAWGDYGNDSLLQPASSGQSMNCSFSHFRVGFTRESGRLPLDVGAHVVKRLEQPQKAAYSTKLLSVHLIQTLLCCAKTHCVLQITTNHKIDLN